MRDRYGGPEVVVAPKGKVVILSATDSAETVLHGP